MTYYITDAVDTMPICEFLGIVQPPIERVLYLWDEPETPTRLHFVLTLDVSSSMDEETTLIHKSRLDIVKFCIRQLINNLDKDTRLTLVVFGDNAHVCFDGTVGTYDNKIFDGEKIQCLTNLEEGLRLCSKIIMSSDASTIIQIVMTDGYPTIGSTSVAELRQTIQSKVEQTHILCMFAISSHADYELCQSLTKSRAHFGLVMKCSDDSMESISKEIGNIIGISRNVSKYTGSLYFTSGFVSNWQSVKLNNIVTTHVFTEQTIRAIYVNGHGLHIQLGVDLSTIMLTLEIISTYTIELLHCSTNQNELPTIALGRHPTDCDIGYVEIPTMSKIQKQSSLHILQIAICYIDNLDVVGELFVTNVLNPIKERCRKHLMVLQQQLESNIYTVTEGLSLLRDLSNVSHLCRQQSVKMEQEFRGYFL